MGYHMNEETVYFIGTDTTSHELVARASEFLQVKTKIFETAEEFLDGSYYDSHGCVLTEIQLRGMNGVALQERLKDLCILPLVFLMRVARTHLIVRAMQNGAVTVLEQPPSESELSAAIERALKLHRLRHRRRIELQAMDFRLRRLTEGERNVLKLIMSGIKNSSIARRLDVSVRTIEARRKRIFVKTETESLAELIRLVTFVQFKLPYSARIDRDHETYSVYTECRTRL